MKLLAATNRYYALLSAGLFAVGSVVLYVRVDHAFRHEVGEQLAGQRQEVLARLGAGQPLPEIGHQLTLSARPRPEGYSDTTITDPIEHEPVPHRQLTFRAGPAAHPVWVTLRRSLVETDDLLRVVVGSMVGLLALLLLGVVGLHQLLARRLWAPFRHTLGALRRYDLARHQPLALPAPAIREFAELNLALNHLSERLVADYDTLREFTANAAHETQTPLAIMQAQLEQLLQLPALATDPAAAPLLADLYGATRRLSRLHQALGLLSRIENRQFAAAEAIDLPALLRHKAEALAPLLEARGLALHLDLAAAPALALHPGLADSLLHNLLYNAIRHNLPGGDVRVCLSGERLEISNPGAAVAGDPARFFERFRKHNAASDSPGLGLSIVKHICAYYGLGLRYAYEPAGSRHVLTVLFGPAGQPRLPTELTFA